MSWLEQTAQGHCLLRLHVQPGAKRTEIAGLYGTALKIRLAAPPVDGKANEALIAFIAGQLAVPKSSVRIKSGASARQKVLVISDADSENLRRWAQEALNAS